MNETYTNPEWQAPDVHGLDYYGKCQPAEDKSKDFFDFLPSPSQGLAVSLGDICAEGFGGAIMRSGLQAIVRGLTADGSADISNLVADLNRTVFEASPESFYATLFYARIDPFRRQLHYVSAGHEAPLLVRNGCGRVQRLDSTGAVLGLSAHSAYERRTVALELGDVLIAFTDGVTDAVSSTGRV